MPSNSRQLAWSKITGTGVFLGGLAGIMYQRVASPDYKQLVDSIKANGCLLYPNLSNAIVHTFRIQLYPQREFSDDDLWTATLSTKATRIALAEVSGRRSREQALMALNRMLRTAWDEKTEQARLRSGHERGEEFE